MIFTAEKKNNDCILHRFIFHNVFLNLVSDEKAISFVQAEKLYYESVLVDSSEIQKQIGGYYKFLIDNGIVMVIIK